MNRLNIEIVKQAISELKTKGIKPTNKAIIEHVGYGSFSTLTKLRQQYPRVFDTPIVQCINTDNSTTNTFQSSTVHASISQWDKSRQYYIAGLGRDDTPITANGSRLQSAIVRIKEIKPLNNLPVSSIVQVESIQKTGCLLQPLILQRLTNGYQLLEGADRLANVIASGLTQVDAFILEFEQDWDVLKGQIQSTVQSTFYGTDTSNLNINTSTVDVIWNAISERVDNRIDDKLNGNKDEINKLRQQLKDTETEVEMLQAKENELLDQIQFQKGRVDDIAVRNNLLEKERDVLQTELDEQNATAIQIVESFGEGYEDTLSYKEDYFRLIEENAQIREGLWPSKETEDGYQKLGVKELTVPIQAIPKLRDYAHKHCNGSQHDAISQLVEKGLGIPTKKISVTDSNKASKHKYSNELAKARLFELKKKYPRWSLQKISGQLAKEGILNRTGKPFGTGTLTKWLNPKKYKTEKT